VGLVLDLIPIHKELFYVEKGTNLSVYLQFPDDLSFPDGSTRPEDLTIIDRRDSTRRPIRFRIIPPQVSNGFQTLFSYKDAVLHGS